jgi:hypothetical protein
MNYVYTRKDGRAVIRFLRAHHMDGKLIGTLPSNHDIDILITKTYGHLWKYELRQIFGYKRIMCDFPTEAGSYFMHIVGFGHLDFFYGKYSKRKAKEELKKGWISCPNCYLDFQSP